MVRENIECIKVNSRNPSIDKYFVTVIVNESVVAFKDHNFTYEFPKDKLLEILEREV